MHRDEGEGDLEFLNDLQGPAELDDVRLELAGQGRREDVRPKVFALPKANSTRVSAAPRYK